MSRLLNLYICVALIMHTSASRSYVDKRSDDLSHLQIDENDTSTLLNSGWEQYYWVDDANRTIVSSRKYEAIQDSKYVSLVGPEIHTTCVLEGRHIQPAPCIVCSANDWECAETEAYRYEIACTYYDTTEACGLDLREALAKYSKNCAVVYAHLLPGDDSMNYGFPRYCQDGIPSFFKSRCDSHEQQWGTPERRKDEDVERSAQPSLGGSMIALVLLNIVLISSILLV